MDDIIFVETNSTGHGVRALDYCAGLGLRSVFLTCQPEYYEASVLAGVSRVEVVDTQSPEAMLPYVRLEATRGVLTFLDYPLVAAIDLAAKVGVPHPDRDAVQRCRSKDAARRAIGPGDDQPKFQVFDKSKAPAVSPVGYPCVLKPADDTGSIGVTICRNHEEFRTAVEKEAARNVADRGFDLLPRMLVEEYIEGPEFSAELLCTGGRWHLLGITRKLVSSPPFAVCTGHVFPARLDEPIQRSIRDRVMGWMNAVGLDFGAAHVEFRMTPKGPVLIEINPRLGGALVSELIRHATAFDVVEYLLRQACALPTPDLPHRPASAAAALVYLYSSSAGTIVQVEGADALELMPNVLEFQLPKAGDTVRPLQNDCDRLGYVIARGDDEHEALSRAQDAAGRISIEVQARP